MKTHNSFLAWTLFFIATYSLKAQTLSPTFSINAAGTANTFKGGYTFAYASSGTPWNGALISFGGFSNQYDCQISANYTGNNISFRTKNGDLAGGAGIWNSWNELTTSTNLFSSISSQEGGKLTLFNPSKTATNSANQWALYNMTGSYGNSLQFWNYGVTGFAGGPKFTILDGGNVGIGTQTPAAKLDIFGNNSTSTNLILSANYKDSYRWRFNTLDRGNAIDLDFTASNNLDEQEQVLKLSRSTSGRPEFQLYDNAIVVNDGKVAIGKAIPSAKLDVNGEAIIDEANSNYSNVRFGHDANDRIIADNSPTKIYGGGYWFRVHNGANSYIDALQLRDNGNVGIGCNPDAKLTVKGQIHAQEVKIDLLGAMIPDYVFANDYKLKTLKEVDEYIKANSHLPEIPSATEMTKNGMLVSEMNLSLLKKIEELTLYAIEQQKKLDMQNKVVTEQNNAIVTQGKQIALLIERLSILEKK